ncbi:MAG: group 1 truncated hemoglobin [Alphaproteobacteria bacterium]
MRLQAAKPAAARPAAAREKAGLYERLGGLYPIARMVDDFIDHLVVNETLNANEAVLRARDPTTRPGLKYHVTAFVAEAVGGPQVYTGRTMKETHVRLNISGREWRAMMADLEAVLFRFNVPDAEQREIVALVASLERDIVTRPGE